MYHFSRPPFTARRALRLAYRAIMRRARQLGVALARRPLSKAEGAALASLISLAPFYPWPAMLFIAGAALAYLAHLAVEALAA